MDLRRVAVEDWQAVRNVRLRALTLDPNAFCSSLERESAFDGQAWRNRVSSGITVLAWDGEDPVATISGKVDPHEDGGREIVALWVAPSVRGEGLADALVHQVIDWARSESAHEVALWVAEDNEHALTLYERVGFAATGERDVMRPGVDQIRLRLPLLAVSLPEPAAPSLR